MAHTRTQMVPEVLSSRLDSIECLADQINLPTFFYYKFRATQDVIFLGYRNSQVGITNVSSKNVQTIQRGVREQNSNNMYGYYSSISLYDWIGSLVSINNPSGFVCEFHLYISKEVASHLATYNRRLQILLKHFKIYSDLGHLVGESAFP